MPRLIGERRSKRMERDIFTERLTVRESDKGRENLTEREIERDRERD